ncbi:Uma2 family endonuclease [Streptomyces sp. RB6PN25]|uniref:Uma2 family endonuclease n=1 Tax=Streptomyces humicola TaxID=2953240 RepID=A0ABT1PV47_9ACTN|nr:Uma2 family endonuclease [Streptomyces humicola]MCQ4080420.1 Uma2 family endonuclease [Streptomyces humicola]
MTVMDQGNAHDLVRLLEDIPEFDGYKIELIDGNIKMQASATPIHNFIQASVASAFITRGWWSLTEQALISQVAGFEPKPDTVVTAAGKADDNANPFPADRVELIVEIVSTDKDSDYIKKRMWYARSGIPLYVLIDPNDGVCELYSEPHGGVYRTTRTSEFGEPVLLPSPFDFSLDTTSFRLYPPR